MIPMYLLDLWPTSFPPLLLPSESDFLFTATLTESRVRSQPSLSSTCHNINPLDRNCQTSWFKTRHSLYIIISSKITSQLSLSSSFFLLTILPTLPHPPPLQTNPSHRASFPPTKEHPEYYNALFKVLIRRFCAICNGSRWWLPDLCQTALRRK